MKWILIFIYWGASYQYSYYLFDDISVVETNLPADAGPDRWVEKGKTVQIGRVGDSTAQAIDCKWYHKGRLIDSGAIVSVAANLSAGAIDTYIVVQTICGAVKTDTTTVRTVPAGVKEWNTHYAVNIYPNPSSGIVYIQSSNALEQVRILDISGRTVQQLANLSANTITLQLGSGYYFVETTDKKGNTERQRLCVQ
ncbi:MAG: T9SS type A sorting domain-containing protein [Chitinophagaceae bacterium]